MDTVYEILSYNLALSSSVKMFQNISSSLQSPSERDVMVVSNATMN